MQPNTTYERFDFDFYPTPPSCVEAVYNHLSDLIDFESPKLVCDPGAGTGIWGQVYKEIFNSDVEFAGIEIQDMSKPDLYDYWTNNTDFLSEFLNLDNCFDLVVGNPPYKFAEKFVRKGLEIVKPGGHVVYLLRLAFLESIKRCEDLYKNLPPVRVTISSRRPSFHLTRNTGYTAYGVFVWEKGWTGGTSLEWMNWDYNDKWLHIVEKAKKHLGILGALENYVES